MPKKERSRSYCVEIQKGPISMDESNSNMLRRERGHVPKELDNNRMRQEKMTLTIHVPKQ